MGLVSDFRDEQGLKMVSQQCEHNAYWIIYLKMTKVIIFVRNLKGVLPHSDLIMAI